MIIINLADTLNGLGEYVELQITYDSSYPERYSTSIL